VATAREHTDVAFHEAVLAALLAARDRQAT
jgi:hypothetical protein